MLGLSELHMGLFIPQLLERWSGDARHGSMMDSWLSASCFFGVFCLCALPMTGYCRGCQLHGSQDHRDSTEQQGRTSQPRLFHLPAKGLGKMGVSEAVPSPGIGHFPGGSDRPISTAGCGMFTYIKHMLDLEVTRLSFNMGI